jgi:hypothetical protein
MFVDDAALAFDDNENGYAGVIMRQDFLASRSLKCLVLLFDVNDAMPADSFICC